MNIRDIVVVGATERHFSCTMKVFFKPCFGFHHSFPEVKHSKHQSKSKRDAIDFFSAELSTDDKFPPAQTAIHALLTLT